ncbi:pol-RFamide neuropeptides isoform X1 [Hydra vulgaris]|uniref:pol-RFamide neuropeptides isoform X1 n=1 Tax=Hydra vulgaris TaxID=6087 RepID=UPI000641117D|nr:pol-RFamide neuropeptides [Hydra vulgaris]
MVKMLNQRKVELFFALALIVVALVKSDNNNHLSEDNKNNNHLSEDNKNIKRIIEDYLNAKNAEQLTRGKFMKKITNKEDDFKNEAEYEYENKYGDELKNHVLVNKREDAAQWFNGRFGREMGERFLPRFGKELNKPHLRGRFGRSLKL